MKNPIGKTGIVCGGIMMLVLLYTPYASSDTILMKNGVQITGLVQREAGDFLVLSVGDRTVRVRKNEVHAVEKNDLDGALDLEAVQREAEAQDKALTEQTGLNRSQREEVLMYVGRLADPDATKAREARRALLAMGAKMDLFPFIEFILPSYLPNTVCLVLKILGELAPDRAQPLFREYVFSPDEHVRSVCIQLLAGSQDDGSLELILRGMLDHTNTVKISACKALAETGAQEATPLLLACYSHADARVEHNAREALSRIWSGDAGKVVFNSREEWESFWEANRESVQTSVDLAALEPLVPPGTRHPGC